MGITNSHVEDPQVVMAPQAAHYRQWGLAVANSNCLRYMPSNTERIKAAIAQGHDQQSPLITMERGENNHNFNPLPEEI